LPPNLCGEKTERKYNPNGRSPSSTHPLEFTTVADRWRSYQGMRSPDRTRLNPSRAIERLACGKLDV
jgi:hypothetical protein